MQFSQKLILLIFLALLRINSQGQNLIAHYPFDNSVLDISGNNNHGIIFGGVEVTTDRFGNPCGAMLFNGKDGFVEVADSKTIKSPTNAFSATCWFKIQTPSTTFKWLTLICKGNYLTETPYNPQYRVQVFQSLSQSTISVNTEFTEYDNNYNSHLFQNDEWHFYALVYDGEYVRTYLDGDEIWKFPYRNPLIQNDEPLHIGKDVPGAIEYFSGSFDDLRIFNTALDARQINRIYKDDSYAEFEHDFNLICPDNISVTTDKNQCFATVMFDKPVLDIKCGTADVKQISGPLSGTEFPIGTSTLVFEGKSSYGVQKSCYSKVIVKDIEPPVFDFLRDTSFIIDNPDLKGIAYSYKLPQATDNCSVTIKLKSGLPGGSVFPEGKTVLAFIATDNAGNQAEAFYTVHVLKKNKSSTSKCPEDIIRANNYHQCGAIVHYTVPDSMEGQSMKLKEGNSSGSFYKVGDTKNKYVNAASGECSFMVTVYDDEKPEMQCLSDTIIYLKTGQKGTSYFYSTPEASDNCKIETVRQVKGLKSGEIFPEGVTQNVFIAKDIYGNSVQCSFNVTVIGLNKEKEKPNDEPVIKVDKIKDSIKYYKQRLEFKKCILTLAIYDDSKEDGDTVSIFFNGKEIVERELITIKKNGTINRALILEPGIDNYFIFKAWNEGKISPNTMRIEFYEGYYLDRMDKIRRRKLAKSIVMHAKVGVASAISLKCKN